MKKVFRTIVVLAVAAVAMSACKKEQQEFPASNGIKVEFVAHSLDTRTEFGTASGSSIPVLWQAGDKVKVMAGVTEGSALEVTPSSDFKTGTFSAELPESFPYTVYALSPSSAFVSCSSNSTYGNYLQYIISTSQTPPKGNVDPAAQVLLAKTDELTAAPEGKLSVNFKHLGAYGKLSLKNLNTNGKEVKSIALDFGTVGVAGRFIYEHADPANNKEAANHINPNSQAYSITINTSETENVLFGVGAVDISGATLKVTVTVADGSFVKTITVPAGKEFKEGVISAFAIDMSGAEFAKARTFRLLTDISTLAEGDNIIIASAKSDYATDNIQGHSVLSTQVNTNNLQATCCEDCFIEDGAAIYNPPTNVEVLTVSKSSVSGAWLLQAASSGGYLSRKNTGKTSNYACYYSADEMAGDEKILKSASWSISEEDSATHAMEMKSNCPLSGYTRVYFRTNIGSTYIFSCYESDKQDPVCIYREDTTAGPEPEPKLTIERVWGKFSTSSASWNEYYGGTPNTDRNVAMDDNYVYIAETRTDAAKLWAISITDPSNVKEVNTTGVSGGFWPLACPRVISDANGVGYLMATNMNGTGETGANPKLYIWKDGIDAAPEAIELNCSNPYERIGDTFSFWGTYDKGMLLLASTSGNIRMWKFVNKVLENGSWVNCRYIVTPKVEGVAAYYPFPDDKNHGVYAIRSEVQAYNAAIEDNADAWAGKKNPDDPTGPRLTAFNLNVTSSGTNYFLNAPSFQYIPFNGKKYLAHTRQVSTMDGRIVITEGEGSDTWAQVLAKRHSGSVLYQAAIQEDAAMQDEYNPSPKESGHSGMDIAWREIDGALYIACVKQNVGLSLFKMSMK